jgi:hypothetical protein
MISSDSLIGSDILLMTFNNDGMHRFQRLKVVLNKDAMHTGD